MASDVETSGEPGAETGAAYPSQETRASCNAEPTEQGARVKGRVRGKVRGPWERMGWNKGKQLYSFWASLVRPLVVQALSSSPGEDDRHVNDTTAQLLTDL